MEDTSVVGQEMDTGKQSWRSRLRARTGLGDKTVWDWLQLLIVPLALAVIGLWFTREQEVRQQKVEEQRAQDIALQGYLDQMGTLMLEDLSNPKVQTLMRARTLTILKRLDPNRKTEVLKFLVEAELIQNEPFNMDEGDPVLELNTADLSGADIRDVDLNKTNLVNVNLRDANLSDADLSRATLTNADLSGAILTNADLSEAYLYGADLGGANLSYANLGDSDLSYANLTDADLSEAYLYGASITSDELDQVKSLKGATMPRGSEHP